LAWASEFSKNNEIGANIMMRSLTLAAALTSALAVSAMAADATTAVDPAAVPAAAATVPAPAPAVAAAPAVASLTLTTQDGLAWANKPVYSLDGTNLGKVVDFQRGTDNAVIGMHADVGGFWGIGMTRVSLKTPQFKLQGDRVVLSLTAAEVKALPAI
jgi:opacity protein-like surface antigen